MEIKSVVQILETITKNPYRKTNTGWLGLCPVHKDANPSLGVSELDGVVVMNCFAGCDYKDIKKAIETRTCFYDPGDIVIDSRPPWEKTPLAIYDYRDKDGKLLFQKLRFANKEFAIRQPQGRKWRWTMRGLQPVIYNLPEVIAARVVAIVEGEKDADTLTNLGLVATTNFDGAYGGRWNTVHNPWFYDKHVLVFADNDAPGISHGEHIYNSLSLEKVLSKAWMHPLEGLSYKQDVTDWILLGHTLADIRALWVKKAKHR